MATLLLTTTIDCGNCSTLQIKNHNERKKTYLYVIEKYLKETNFNLTIVENSNYDLSFIKDSFEEYKERIELLSFDGNHDTDKFGKGYGEKNSIIYALNNSSNLSKDEFFYKVSGRYYSPDIKEIINNSIDSLKNKTLLSINRFNQSNGNIATVFFGVNKKIFLETFTKELILHDLGILFETAYANMVSKIPNNKIFWLDEMEYENAISSNNEIIKKY